MVAFAGYELPLEFSGVRNEHRAVREAAGIFDVSHMGEIRISGPGAQDLVQMLTTNDVGKLVPGRIQYTCMPNEQGGIVDDLLVYCMAEQDYLLVVNAANIEKDHQWILSHRTAGAEVVNASERTAQLAIQGPRATEILQKLTPVDLSSVPYYHFREGELAGVPGVVLSNSGYTGAGGFEIYAENEAAPEIYRQVMKAGEGASLVPAGLASRDTLRLEMGFCLYGNDIDDHTSPLEAGLGWITKFVDGNRFINREALEAQKSSGLKRRLIGFELLERGIPRQHYPLLNPKGLRIGEVTSGTMSPMTGKGIGLGYAEAEYAGEGTKICVEIRNRQLEAVVVRPPFYRPGK